MNRFSPRAYKLVLGVLIVALLSTSHFSQSRLNGLRRELGLTRLEPLKNAPPLLAVSSVVLGGFRGLISNVLWVRAMELQENDQFFEMAQLADWITKLQPHIATVWMVQAWNMSYNISVKFSEPADRWLWVQRGIHLLRDEGLKYNPNNVDIYRELAWHFQHKMGHNLDDAHLFYKSVWATQMQELLGGGRPDFDELLNPQTEDAKRRSQILREYYKLDPAIMKAVDEAYGPLEWRLPETHAIYWAYLGKLNASTKDQLIKLRRVLYQSMFLAFHRGKLTRNRANDTVEFGPNLEIAEKTNATFLEAMAEDNEMRDHIGRAHKNFLLDCVYYFYTHNRVSQAQRWLDLVKEKYPNDYPKDMTLDQYAIGVRLREDVGETDQNRVTAHIRGLLTQSYVNLARDDEDQAAGYAALAKAVWTTYMSKIVGGASDKRVPLFPLDSMQRDVVRELLNPESGLVEEMAAVLRTKIPELAAEIDAEYARDAAATNAPPAVVPAPRSP